MSFKTILPGAWELTQDVNFNLFTLKVPEPWQQVAKSLAQQRFHLTVQGYPSVPVYSLDSILSACFPQIVQTVRHGWKYAGNPWLLSQEKAGLDLLPDLIKDWLREEFSDSLGEENVNEALNKLNPKDWQWEDNPMTYPLVTKDKSSLKKEKNFPNIDVRWQALPDYLATEFLKNPMVSFGQEKQYQLTFYRVARLTQGAELMSWPPSAVTVQKGKEVKIANISFVIRFKLQTVPWRDEPMIFHHLSLRRWINESLEKLPYSGATAYIGDNRRWLDGTRQPFCLMPLAMKKRGKDAKWPQAIKELIKIDNRELPDPLTLASNPTDNWSIFEPEGNNLQAAISYDSRHRGDVPCLPGVSPLDLYSLDLAIQDRLRVRRVGRGKKVGTIVSFWEQGKSKKRDDKTQKDPNDLTTPMLRPKMVAPAVFREREYPLQTILILWETEDCREAIITQICQLLCLSSIPEETNTYTTPNGGEGTKTLYKGESGSLCLQTQHVEDLTQKLDIKNPSHSGRNRQQKRVHLLTERIEKIKLALPEPEELSGALVEIKEKESFFPPESDPKLAIRIALAQQGYLNQHLHAVTAHNKQREKYPLKGAEQRVRNAVSDLLRQFGILPIPLINEEKDPVKSNLWLTCFYILRRTRKTTASNTPSMVALMIRVNPITGTVEMTTPSLFNSEGWVSYSFGLSQLLSEKWDPDSSFEDEVSETNQEQDLSKKEKDKRLLNQFVSNCLRDCLNKHIIEDSPPRVLLMTEAHNARKFLTWLRNPDLPANNLPDELKLTDSEKKRLWLVRLRTAINQEVPVNIVENYQVSRATGLVQWQTIKGKKENSGNLYLSLRKPLTTEQNILKKSESRLDNGGKPSAISSPLEIATIYHPGIDATELASFVHNLRDRWPYFADYVSLPFPFPFAINAKEYAVSVKDSVELDQSTDEDEEFIQLDLFSLLPN